MSAHTYPSRLRERFARVRALMRTIALASMLATAAAITSQPATSASGGTTVGATIPSATAIDVAGCSSGAAVDFGTLLADQLARTGADCIVEFESSNDTASLRIAQADGEGDAMWSQQPVPDTTFGDGGDGISAFTDLDGTLNEGVGDLLQLPDRRTIVVANSRLLAAGNPDVYTLRYTAAGTLDPTYGGGDGIAGPLDFGSAEWASSSHLNTDGSMFVSVLRYDGSGWKLGIIKLTSTGAIDMTWGGGDGHTNWVGVTPTSTQSPGTMLVRPDGRLLLVGRYSDGGPTDVATFQFTAAGALDPTFGGGDGIATYDLDPANDDGLGEAVLLPSGATVAALTIGAAGATQVVPIRITDTGALDPTFGGGDGIGDVIDPTPSGDSAATYLNVTSSGALRAAVAVSDGNFSIGMVGWTQSGAMDGTFGGGDGISPRFTGGGLGLLPQWMMELPGGYFLLAVGDSVGGGPRLARFTPAGAIDTSYGGGDGIGDVVTIPGGLGTAAGLLGEDGHIYTTAVNWASGTSDIGVMRWDAEQMPQYVDGASDWNTAAPNDAAFGACLSSTTGAVTARWAVAAGCPLVDGPAWNEVPTSSGLATAEIAETSATGTLGAEAHLRFGMRTASDQPPGRYTAPVTFEVVAPG